MAQHLSEEEQIEALKRWWKENWLSIVVPIIVAVVGYVGWIFWQDNQEQRAQAASVQYQELLSLVDEVGGPDTELTDTQKAQARDLATSIIEQYSDSMYADLSGLLLARLAVDAGNYEEAEAILRTVATQTDDEGLAQLANARLAKVLLNLGEYDEALTLVSQPQDDAYRALYAEIRGDIYVAQDKPAEAHTAYQQALEALDPQQFSRRSLLQVKLDSTAVAGVEVAAAETAPAETAPGNANMEVQADDGSTPEETQ